ncbi:hypothetical protein OG21DRAFT_1607246 [Imleria badia]|nr:hypothetical protein OG21DRAFT_1607246 [Imleria badia]
MTTPTGKHSRKDLAKGHHPVCVLGAEPKPRATTLSPRSSWDHPLPPVRLESCLKAPLPVIQILPLSNPQFVVERSTDVPQESWRWRRLYPNLRAILSRFFTLAYKPRHFAPLVVDYWLLLQSNWSGKQSGRLARLILEHSRDRWSSELHPTAPFPKGIDPPCVAVIDLDEVPEHVVENGYSTQVDIYGLICMLILFETMITFIVHVFHLFGSGWAIWLNWIYCAIVNLNFAFNAVLRGDGTLTLAQRLDTSTLGCAVLLDQDFTVILNGNQSVVEAITESSFNLSHPNSIGRRSLGGENDGRDSSHDSLEALCEGACLTVFALCWLLLFRPSTVGGLVLLAIIVCIVACLLQMFPPDQITFRRRAMFAAIGFPSRILPPLLCLAIYTQVTTGSPIFAFSWHFLSAFLLGFFLAGYKPQNYPIRSAKFLDALGHPAVRKWQLAAAATFQCLILCRGIARPIRTIDVFALLDLLVPDQRDVWKAWKARVAVHETDISFTPTIPTFGDERQQQLKDLLDQAQFGYDTYRRFYVCRIPLLPVT